MKSRPNEGIVTTYTEGYKADGTVFLSFERIVSCRSAATAPPTDCNAPSLATATRDRRDNRRDRRCNRPRRARRAGAPHPRRRRRSSLAKEVAPFAQKLEHNDTYPEEIVARMKELGLFGCIIPQEYGGLGLPPPPTPR